ncbi:MAG TPA: hypothetical protein VLQ89_08410 [Candidatus Binatia bacterium]|nr:hypothetical protein [Candidatus Binatia bacterium]
MNAMERCKKPAARTVLLTFFWLSFLSRAPLPAATENEGRSPSVFEKAAANEPAVQKKNVLPLVLIGVGVLAVAAALYFFVFKGDAEKVHDDFDTTADPLWLPRTASAWTVAGGAYVCQKAKGTAPSNWWEWSLYNRSWSKPDYTVIMRARVTANLGPFGLLLVSDPGMEAVNGYQIMFMDDQFFVRKVQGWNYKASTASDYTWIKEWTSSPAILGGVSVWNTFTLVKAGGTYKIYANDILAFTFTDATYDPRLVAVAVHTQSQAMHLEVDSFHIDLD